MKTKPTIAGFFSYVHADDEYDGGRISRLRQRLQIAIQVHSGFREFRVFQDREGIEWGQQWEKVIGESINDSVLLFPVLTPLYFSSDACREEILAFQERQTKLKRNDLILPIYYLFSEMMDHPDENVSPSEEAKVAELLRRIQFEDWRALRKTEETDLAYAEGIERLAQRAIPALKRGVGARSQSSSRGENQTEESGEDGGRRRRAAKPEGTKQQLRSTRSPRRPATKSAAKAAEPRKPADATRRPAAGVADGQGSPGYVVTVTVDQMPGRGEFTTISEAVARAAAGARVRIRPGHYREHLVINKPLELVGDGPREDIVVEADSSNALVFDTNIGVVRGLTVRQTGTRNFFAIWIKQGRLSLEDCELSSANHSCLAVSNNADPRVRRNLIHNGIQCGIIVFDQGRGTYEDNEIFNNKIAGIVVQEEAEPTVRRNRIHDNNLGIFVYQKGHGTFEDNDVFGNALSGFAARAEADPIVRRNRIHENEQNGIYAFEKARGTYEENDVFGNSFSGFAARTEADPIVRRNRIHENKQSGIYAYENGRGTYEDNDVFGNELSGLAASAEANPIARRNKIHENKNDGIYAYENGRGIYEENHLFGNAMSGFSTTEEAEPVVRRNRIFENKENGVDASENGRGTFEDNDIFGNEQAGIYVGSGGAPAVLGNRINKNGYEAIWVDEGGGGRYDDNDLRENTRGSWDIHASVIAELKRARNIEK